VSGRPVNENPTTGANACIMGAEEGEKDGTAKRRE